MIITLFWLFYIFQTFLLFRYEQQLDNLRSQSFNMEQANYAHQTLKDTHATVAAMKDGVKQMKKEFKKINIEEIDVHNYFCYKLSGCHIVFYLQDIQDEMADLLDQSEEVQDALGRNYNTPELDDDELAAELEALGDEIALDDDTSYLDDVVKAPEAPSKEPGADTTKNKVIASSNFIVVASLNKFVIF